MTKITKSVIKTNSGKWDFRESPKGNVYLTTIDNYTTPEFNGVLAYFGNHPPDIEENTQYKADLKHVNKNGKNYYILVNSDAKEGPLYFEKYVSSKKVGNKTTFTKMKIQDKKEAYVGELMNIDGIGEKTARILVDDNIKTIKAVANMTMGDLQSYEGIGKKTAERIHESAASLAGIEVDYEKFKEKHARYSHMVPSPKLEEVPMEREEISVTHTRTVESIPRPGQKPNIIDFSLFDTDDISKKIITSVSKGAKNSMDYKVKGRTLRSSQMGKDHAYIFLDTYYHELPTAWKQSIREIEAEQLDGNLGNTTPGTAAHEYFQLAMEAVASKYQEVQLLSHELPLVADYGDFRSKGHYDGLLRVKDTKGNYQLMVMDIKTTGGKWYDLMVKNFEQAKPQWETHLQRVANREIEYNPTELANGVLDFTILDPYHLCQLHDYMYKMGVKHAIIVYVSKKDYSVYVVYVPYIQAIVDFNMKWGREAIHYRKKLNVIPSPIHKDVEDYHHFKTGEKLEFPSKNEWDKHKNMLDYPCRKFDKYGVLKYQCKFIRVCYDRERLGKYNGEVI